MKQLQADRGEVGEVEACRLRAADHHLREAVEILLPFAAAEIDAEAGRIVDAAVDARIRHRLLGGAGGELRVSPAVGTGISPPLVCNDVPVSIHS